MDNITVECVGSGKYIIVIREVADSEIDALDEAQKDIRREHALRVAKRKHGRA